jgi:hypothetical protein
MEGRLRTIADCRAAWVRIEPRLSLEQYRQILNSARRIVSERKAPAKRPASRALERKAPAKRHEPVLLSTEEEQEEEEEDAALVGELVNALNEAERALDVAFLRSIHFDHSVSEDADLLPTDNSPIACAIRESKLLTTERQQVVALERARHLHATYTADELRKFMNGASHHNMKKHELAVHLAIQWNAAAAEGQVAIRALPVVAKSSLERIKDSPENALAECRQAWNASEEIARVNSGARDVFVDQLWDHANGDADMLHKWFGGRRVSIVRWRARRRCGEVFGAFPALAYQLGLKINGDNAASILHTMRSNDVVSAFHTRLMQRFGALLVE